MAPALPSLRDVRRRALPTRIDVKGLRRFKAWTLPLCAACLLLSAWMVIHSLTGVQLAGCSAGSACDDVTGSPWAYVLGGVPVSLAAGVVYALLLICLLFLGGERAEDRSLDRLLWRLMPLLCGCIVGAALWFGWLQLGVLHAFCKYCTALHLLGCILAVLVFVQARRSGGRPALPFAAGLAAAALFAFIQSRTLPDSVYDSGRSDADLPAFADGEVPVLGEGPVTLTLLFDFQCIHCRRLHRILPEFLTLTEGRYSICLCPVPLSSACNPYIPASGIDRFAGSCTLTRLALAVWYARPDACLGYWDYLLGDGDERRQTDPAAAETRAREILGADFEAALQDPRIEACLRKGYELFGRTSSSEKSGIPRLILGQDWLVPQTDSAEALAELVAMLAVE